MLLIATHDSGSSVVYSLLRAQNSSWMVKESTEAADAMSHPLPGGSVVIDSRTGNRWKANRNGLATVMASLPEDSSHSEGARKTIWVTAGAKGVKCVVNVTGERVERVDWSSKAGKVERVEVIHKNGMSIACLQCPVH